ncbi:MAG: M48 family metalloprotease [Candidatus Gastranaerophilales bacterium]|nr:M48 family metalloprotease [Candidatus Gastranaerophilales bacterium]
MKKIVVILLSLYLFTNNLSIYAQEKQKKVKPSALSGAIIEGKIETVKEYIKQGANLDKPFLGSTPLVDAIYKKQHEILDCLLQAGANPNVETGVPPLYMAVSEKNKYATAKLLKAGANTNKTFMGMTAKELAETYKTKEIIEIFNDYENNIEKFNPDAYKNSYIVKEARNTKETKEFKEETLSANIIFNLDKKDTNLISIQKTKPINSKNYNQKIKSDYIEYQKNKKQLNEEQYSLYIILDKLLRANKLQYQNWRIGIDIDTHEVNAYAGSANLIIINSSLYDSLYNNQDALAFIVAHELAHLILGHNQIALENNAKIKKLEYEVQKARAEAQKESYLADINSAVGNYGYALGSSLSSLAYNISATALSSEINRVYAQERELEIIADTEALTLMTKAGFNPAKAKDALEFLVNLPNIYTNRSTHPDNYTRQSNINENLFLNDSQELKNQGKKEIIGSKVLNIKKSSDKKTIVLSKANNCTKHKYVTLSKEDKLIQKAYLNYTDNNNEKAKELFSQAYLVNPNNFIPMLYLSYINEYDFKQNQQKKSLKSARKWAKKANRIAPENKFVKKQNEDIKTIFINLKEQKKNNKKG